jgi:hypothetical protein
MNRMEKEDKQCENDVACVGGCNGYIDFKVTLCCNVTESGAWKYGYTQHTWMGLIAIPYRIQ